MSVLFIRVCPLVPHRVRFAPQNHPFVAAVCTEKMNIDKATFYRRLACNGETFSIKEAEIIAKELNFSKEDVNSIFFADFVA